MTPTGGVAGGTFWWHTKREGEWSRSSKEELGGHHLPPGPQDNVAETRVFKRENPDTQATGIFQSTGGYRGFVDDFYFQRSWWRDFRSQGRMEDARTWNVRATQGWEFRGPVVTDLNRVGGHEEISPPKQAEGNHISTAVQWWKEKASSLWSLPHSWRCHTRESSLLSIPSYGVSHLCLKHSQIETHQMVSYTNTGVRQQSVRMGKAQCESPAGLSPNPSSTHHEMAGELPNLSEALWLHFLMCKMRA